MRPSQFYFFQTTLPWGVWLEDLRGFVRNSEREFRLTREEIAYQASLHAKTVETFADGTVKRPRDKTLKAIADVLYAAKHVDAYTRPATEMPVRHETSEVVRPRKIVRKSFVPPRFKRGDLRVSNRRQSALTN